MEPFMLVKHSGLVVMSAMSKLLCSLCLFYLIPLFMLLLSVLAPCTLPTRLVQGLLLRYLVAGTGGRSAPVLLVPKSHPDTQLPSTVWKSREVQTCSMRLASSQTASVQGYGKSTLSGFHHKLILWPNVGRPAQKLQKEAILWQSFLSLLWSYRRTLGVFKQESCSWVCSLETAQLIQLKFVY